MSLISDDQKIRALVEQLNERDKTIDQLKRSNEVLGTGLLSRDQTIKELREALKNVLPMAEAYYSFNEIEEDKIATEAARKLIEP